MHVRGGKVILLHLTVWCNKCLAGYNAVVSIVRTGGTRRLYHSASYFADCKLPVNWGGGGGGGSVHLSQLLWKKTFVPCVFCVFSLNRHKNSAKQCSHHENNAVKACDHWSPSLSNLLNALIVDTTAITSNSITGLTWGANLDPIYRAMHATYLYSSINTAVIITTMFFSYQISLCTWTLQRHTPPHVVGTIILYS
jgi:hypothetical protein